MIYTIYARQFHWPLAIQRSAAKHLMGSKSAFPPDRNAEIDVWKTADRMAVSSNTLHSKLQFCDSLTHDIENGTADIDIGGGLRTVCRWLPAQHLLTRTQVHVS